MAVSGGVGKNSKGKKAPAKKGPNPFPKGGGGGTMTCPQCGKKMNSAPGSTCPNCGYEVPRGKGRSKKLPPMKGSGKGSY